jgi:pentose-5-phosphate-3-epimerase
MPFIPSLLEYSATELESKLLLIKNNSVEFAKIQKSTDSRTHLHLDFVLPQFAQSRGVEPGNSPEVVFDLISKYFKNSKVVCNAHFMGLKKDNLQLQEYFKNYDFNPNWEYILHFGSEFAQDFRDFERSNSNVQFGVWLDLGDWNDEYDVDEHKTHNILLMTVIAGKSGQKLTPQNRLKALQFAIKNSNLNITIDGGWSVTDELLELKDSKKQPTIVSYSSFWKELENLITS